MAAFDNGLALGADGLEIDVQLSRDGMPVVIHDTTLDRTTDRTGPGQRADRRRAGARRCRLSIRARRRAIRFAARASACRRSRRCWRSIADARVIIEMKDGEPELARAVAASSAEPARSIASASARFTSRSIDVIRAEDPEIATSASQEEARWTLYRSWVRWPWIGARGRTVAFQVPERAGRCASSRRPSCGRRIARAACVQVWVVERAADIAAAVRLGRRRHHLRSARIAVARAIEWLPHARCSEPNDRLTDACNDIYAARERIAPHVSATPLLRHPLLDEETGLDIWVKHENHNPTGAFKVRGGLNLVGALTPDERARGIVTASTGNHGQSIAPGVAACTACGAPCSCPRATTPTRTPRCAPSARRVDEGGRDFDEARERCEQRARADRRALRAFRQRAAADRRRRHLRARDVRGAAGRRRDLRPDRRRHRRVRPDHRAHRARRRSAKIIGVGAGERRRRLPVVEGTRNAWSAKSADTFAEGMATRVTFDLTFGISSRSSTTSCCSREEELAEGVRLALRDDAQPRRRRRVGGACRGLKLRDDLAGQRVVCVMSGGNLDRGQAEDGSSA